MPYDSLMRWETEGGATDPTNGDEPAERPNDEDAERPLPVAPGADKRPESGLDQAAADRVAR
jgi:hypothetical protein